MAPVHRPAARVVCLDADDRVLLLCWRDPVEQNLVWEPPGGGVEPGESFLAAARRELAEETGLDPAAVRGPSVTVDRDTRWRGRRLVGPEAFFLARYDTARPALGRAGLLPDEQQTLTGYAWLTPAELATLPGLQPPELPAVIRRLGTPPATA
ncbi:NUDIX hydrolase [Actinoplanes sp. NPDC049599]|uniref:NUDIX hydrolase n=1 Tax=Actinoplanes sp. NPDC049599 TaxID=3363903 RepID=UPI00378FBE4A